MPEISVLVEGGKASAGAPLGPALGPLGVNIGEIVNSINEKTKNYNGMKVPVKVIVDSGTKEFDIKVGSPPASALIKQELGIDKAAQNPKTEVVGNLSMDQVVKIAKMKMDDLASSEIRSAAREIIGACNSMGVTVDGKKAKIVQGLIVAGKYDSVLGGPVVSDSSPVQNAIAEQKAEEKVKEEEVKTEEKEQKEQTPAVDTEADEKAEALAEGPVESSESNIEQEAEALMEEKSAEPAVVEEAKQNIEQLKEIVEDNSQDKSEEQKEQTKAGENKASEEKKPKPE